jgi:carbonic anhydrase/acetyltransferase-like protein (isoleucine patch superfamily)
VIGRKYKLLRGEIITDPFFPSRNLKVYRIKALRDIPDRKVKKGDIGGFVTDKMTLSHQGKCWIGNNAVVHGAAITGDATVGDNAIIYAGNETTSETIKRLSSIIDTGMRDNFTALARITVEDEVVIKGNAKLTAFSVSETYINPVKIKGGVRIFGEAQLSSPALIGNNVVIYGKAIIGENSRILDNAYIFANAVIGREVTIAGATIVSGDASVGNNSMLFGNLHLSGSVKVAERTRIDNKDNLYLTDACLIQPGDRKLAAQETTGNVEQDTINRLIEKAKTYPSMGKTISTQKITDLIYPEVVMPSANSSKMKKYRELLQEILATLNSYETDIVKIIKYPVMVDRTNDYTASMLSAKRAVSLVDPEMEESEFYASVLKFDKAFQAAEVHALKVCTSLLNPEEQKKTKKAQDLFSIAVDNASTENEKVNAFKQGFKQLEGIILVPDQAITTLRVKAGIAELKV